ncbi:MAG: thioredoxin-like domain-containing protein [Bacteroidota bacterium]
MARVFLFLIFCCHSLTLFSQGYELKFKVEGLADTTFLLGNFFGESTYVKDTAKANSKGEFTFAGNETLEEGMYFLVLNKMRLFDFVVGKDQKFTISTTHPDYIPRMIVSGDIDNELFLKDMLFNADRNKEARPFVQIVQDSLASEEAKKEARSELDKISAKVDEHINEVLGSYPESVLATIMKANQQLEIPDPPTTKNGKEVSEWQYRYYRERYWNSFDLGNPILLRLSRPIYKKKVEEYLDKLIVPDPDSVNTAISKMVETAKGDLNTYKYLVWTTTIKYQSPEIMGLDKVFVYLYDTYFASGEMDYWANDQLKKNLKERADQLRSSLIGMPAPNLIMQDQHLQKKELYSLTNNYTVIYFYDPDCGHCKKETPKLREFHEATKYDVGIFSVSADTSIIKMSDYIATMNIGKWTNVNGPRTYTVNYQKVYDATTTPTIYVLNKDKEIIAKKISAARIEEFIGQYERVTEARKNQN